MNPITRQALPPPLSQVPSSSELERLLDALRAMPTGRDALAPPPPAPVAVTQRRRGHRYGFGTTHPALVRPYVLAALAESHH